MKSHLSIVICLLFPFFVSAAQQHSIIPKPATINFSTGNFIINEKTKITYAGKDTEVVKIIKQFQSQFKIVSGRELQNTRKSKKNYKSVIVFDQTSATNFPDEQYRLNITADRITLTAKTGAGFFYALQTLYQLFPSDIYGKKLAENIKWTIPCAYIEDKPRFSYRGLHLDVCRHFFPVEDIKKFIDAMAIHKLNVFHWHLTDDQGWRLEIKKYPNLVQIGSNRPETLIGHSHQNFPRLYDSKSYSGYYTQEDAREIVRYAQERFITVIPEIEMPGHAQAAIASYPHLSCHRDNSVQVATRWGVFEDVFCSRDETFKFLEDVLTEVLTVFPSQYIHIGGDECPKVNWKKCSDCQARIREENLKDEEELQGYFVKRIERFLNSKGRQIIGWDEILDGGTSEKATIMSWRGEKGGIEAAKLHRKVIMTPMSHCYFDFYQAEAADESTAIGGLLTLQRVYEYDPIPKQLSGKERDFIIGAQANIWTEYIPTYSHVEYMAYPRVSALSEVLWSQSEKDWEDFRKRMNVQYNRYEVLGIQASNSFHNVAIQSSVETDNFMIELSSFNPEVEIRYTTNGKSPDADNSLIYKRPFSLTMSTTITTASFVNGMKIGNDTRKSFVISKLTGKRYTPNTNNFLYNGKNSYALTDGRLGSEKLSTSYWVGFDKGVDAEIIFDLEKEENISKVQLGLLHTPSLCIYVSPEIQIFTSKDGENYHLAASEKLHIDPIGEWRVIRPTITFPAQNSHFLKIVAAYPGFCTPDRPRGGRPSLMLIDEVAAW